MVVSDFLKCQVQCQGLQSYVRLRSELPSLNVTQLCSLLEGYNPDFEFSSMTDFQSGTDKIVSITVHTEPGNEDSADQHASSSRAKRKLGRTGSRSWFNKSFDQNILQKSSKPTQSRTVRRQNSVTDFFQNVFSKSKSHLQDIFTLKKNKQRHKSMAAEDTRQRIQAQDLKLHSTVGKGAEGGYSHKNTQGLNPDMKHNSLHNSCPSFCAVEEVLTHPVILKPRGSLNTGSKNKGSEKRRFTESVKWIPPTHLSATMNMFIVTGPSALKSKSDEVCVNKNQKDCIFEKQSPQFSVWTNDIWKSKLKMSASSLVYPSEGTRFHSPTRSSTKRWSSKIATLSQLGFINTTDEGSLAMRKVCSAPPSRQSVCSATILPDTDDNVRRTKRALVKSSSDAAETLDSYTQPLTKASSDGTYFKTSTASSLALSMTSLGNIMISVTDYLFLGSIEAAYNEPLLCKYNITSLIDMTNVNPALVPPNKKSDCPCACVNMSHFRSKLNIGVDDIEWENLEQYFDDINAFIHGARKNSGRVLIFSYMGQSRAAAAAIQHIMQHYRITYKNALNIVRAKRPQTKLNSGFVKALLRLEKRLDLQDNDAEVRFIELNRADESPVIAHGSVEALDVLSVAPVVRGAWLEC